MKLKMLKELLDGDLKSIIKSMSNSDMKKKLEGLKEGDAVKKVTVASDSEEGLMEGLEKAEELLEGKEKDEDGMMVEGDDSEVEQELEKKALAGMGEEDDSVTEDLPSVEEALKAKKKKSALKGLV